MESSTEILATKLLDFLIAMLPIIGVIAGSWLTYTLNKKSLDGRLMLERISNKKVDLYERLYRLFSDFNQHSRTAFSYAQEDDNRRLATSLKEVEQSALEIMNFFDENDLYIDKDILFQVGATCMVPAGLQINKDADQYHANAKELYEKYNEDYQASIDLIKEYMGLKRIEKHLRRTNKPKTTTAVLDYAHMLEKQYRR